MVGMGVISHTKMKKEERRSCLIIPTSFIKTYWRSGSVVTYGLLPYSWSTHWSCKMSGWGPAVGLLMILGNIQRKLVTFPFSLPE